MAYWEPISRSQWGARTPLVMEPTDPSVSRRYMKQVVTRINVHHSVTVATKNAFADMRVIEDIGFDRFGMFSYSYAIHPTGVTMVGCGLQVGAHTKGYNSTEYGVVFIGNYENMTPTKAQETSFAMLCAYLHQRGVLNLQEVRGHRDTKQTACPGKNLYVRIPTLEVKAKAAINQTPTPPAIPPPGDELTVAEIKDIMDKLNDIEERVVTIERSIPRIWRASNDKKLWLVGPAGKIRVEDDERVAAYILSGIAAPGEIRTANSSWLRQVPTIYDN
jgi:hypothetical protein